MIYKIILLKKIQVFRYTTVQYQFQFPGLGNSIYEMIQLTTLPRLPKFVSDPSAAKSGHSMLLKEKSCRK